MPQPDGLIGPEELAEHVLFRLNVVGVGRAVRPQDAAKVSRAYRSLYDEWWRRGWADWPLDLMPEAALEGLGIVLSARLSYGFKGQPFDQSERDGEVMFCKAMGYPVSPAPVPAVYM
jgi:hypothetical protein